MAADEAGSGGDGGLSKKFAREVNCLADPALGTRKSALKKLSRELTAASVCAAISASGARRQNTRPRCTSRAQTQPDHAAGFFTASLGSALVGLFSDPVERVREDALDLYLALAQLPGSADSLGVALRQALPTFAARIGSSPFGEPSEELRLKLVDLLLFLLVQRSSRDEVAAGLDSVATTLARVAADAFPAVKVAAAKAVQALATAVPRHIPSVATPLVKSTLANTGHQRGKVRGEAVRALGRLLPLCGGAADKLLGEAVLPGLTPRLLDRTASVRQALAGVLGGWLESLPPPSARSHTPAILTLLLTATADAAGEVAGAALAALHGAADALVMRGDGPTPSAGDAPPPDLAVAAEAAAPVEGAGGVGPPPAPSGHVPDTPPPPGYEDIVLPPPFSGRPPASARRLVRHHLPAVLARCVEGVADWKADTRVGAAGALRSALVYAEGGIADALGEVLPALCRATGDEEAAVVAAVKDCAALIGAFLPPAVLLLALLPQVRGEVSGMGGLEHRAAALGVLANSVSGMDGEAFAEHLLATATALADPALGQTTPPSLPPALLAALAACVEVGGPDLAPSAPGTLALLRTGLHLLRPGHSPEVVAAAQEAIQALAAATGAGSHSDLLAVAAPALLALQQGPVASAWSRGDPLRCELDAAVRLAPLAFAQHLPELVELLTLSLSPSRDADLRLAQLALVDTLAGAYGGGDVPPHAKSAMALAGPVLVRDALTPNLAWQVGAVASTVRKVAMAALHGVVEGGHLPPHHAVTVWSQLAPQLTSTLSDDDETTRHISVLCLAALLPAMPRHLDDSGVRRLYPELLKRLDDASDKVRQCACGALAALPAAAAPGAMMGGPVEYTLEALLVHMDDPEADMQAAAAAAARVYAEVDPAHAVKAVQAARSRHRSPVLCDALLQHVQGMGSSAAE